MSTPRRKMIAGNWKLNKTLAEAKGFVDELRRLLGDSFDACDVVIAPPYTALAAVADKLAGCSIKLAAQDLYFADAGAFTGAISAPLLKDAGCHYVLVGHSERRQLFQETLETSRERLQAALRAGLQPILCLGETLDERRQNITHEVIGRQLDAALQGVEPAAFARIVYAYEPVWAIGTGQVATPKEAQDVHHMIRERLRKNGAGDADNSRILYGGSVKPDNAGELLNQPDIDGALVGGASLNAAAFADIVKASQPHATH